MKADKEYECYFFETHKSIKESIFLKKPIHFLIILKQKAFQGPPKKYWLMHFI